MRLAGQVAVVTGAGRGIGRVVAAALAEEGAQVVAVARSEDQLRSLADELGERLVPVPADVRDATAVARVVDVAAGLGPVDLVVHCAAVIESVERPFWQVDADESWRVVETNLRGPMLLTRAVLPGMVGRRRGRVVSVTSRARAAQRTGTYTAYAVSKRALTLLTEALAVSLAGTGVVVLDVLPGLVRTPMTEAMPVWDDVPAEEWTPASATADVVVDVALGRYDERSGTVLDAVALRRR